MNKISIPDVFLYSIPEELDIPKLVYWDAPIQRWFTLASLITRHWTRYEQN